MSAEHDAIRRTANRSHTCGEEVSRRGECQPCDRMAVALRHDPFEGMPYAVCAYHTRADMFPLDEIVAALRGTGGHA